MESLTSAQPGQPVSYLNMWGLFEPYQHQLVTSNFNSLWDAKNSIRSNDPLDNHLLILNGRKLEGVRRCCTNFLLCKQPSFLSRECAPVVAKRNCLVRKGSERGG